MKARTLIFTGEGKGKTTAALGMVLRAVGHGQKVMVIQFIKSCPDTGELAALGRLPGVEVVQKGRGFVPKRDAQKFPKHVTVAREAMALAAERISGNEYDLIVLDEVCGAVAYGLIDEAEVLELVRDQRRKGCLVLTGRHATDGMVMLADTVTEMRCVKHGYGDGIKAQKGVEM